MPPAPIVVLGACFQSLFLVVLVLFLSCSRFRIGAQSRIVTSLSQPVTAGDLPWLSLVNPVSAAVVPSIDILACCEVCCHVPYYLDAGLVRPCLLIFLFEVSRVGEGTHYCTVSLACPSHVYHPRLVARAECNAVNLFFLHF